MLISRFYILKERLIKSGIVQKSRVKDQEAIS